MLTGEFKMRPFGKVIFGPGTATEKVAEEVNRLGARSVLIVTGKTLAHKTDLVHRVKAALGSACTGVFSDAAAHVPSNTVLAGARMAQDLGADALVVVGGSSAVDTAKGIALVVAEGPALDDLRVKFEPPDRWIAPPLLKPKMPIVAIPTTLSGGEYRYRAGITDVSTQVKEPYEDDKLTPRVVILDPQMTVATGQELWAGTCLKTLCDCVEMVCSTRHQPYSDALCTFAVETIFHDLPLSVSEPLDLAARGRIQHTPLMAASVVSAVGGGLAAGLRHRLGGLLTANHGVISSIVFPHVLEFNRTYAADRLALIARSAGLDVRGQSPDDAAQAVIAAVRAIIREMGLPTRLRDIGMRQEDLEPVARDAAADRAARTNPRPFDERQVLELLVNAY